MMMFYGIVEDRHDPMEIGRVRVRVHGRHTDDKQLIATPDLPWSQVLLPTTSAGLSGFGTQHGLVEGTSVWGFYRDNDTMQDPVVCGVLTGVSPAGGYKLTPEGKFLTRNINKGFNDPRRFTPSDYDGTPDGGTPTQSSKRSVGLKNALDTAPIEPESIEIDYEGKGSTITNPTITAEDLPFYPLKDRRDQSDLSQFARGDVLSKDMSVVGFKSESEPKYPYNKVLHSESGHVLEVDDTLGKERLSMYHRSGSFQEIQPDGSVATRVVNNNYQVVCKDNEIYIGGKVNVKILGDAKLDIGGDADIDVKGKLDIDADDDINITSKKIIKLAADTKVIING